MFINLLMPLILMYDVIIIGSGPAGLTAAIYASRAGLKTLVLEGNQPGGQLMLTSDVENFPGYPAGIHGPKMMEDLSIQAKRFGGQIETAEMIGVDFSKRPFAIKTADKEYSGRTVIIATGASAKWLGLESEKRLQGRGVSGCATCDAPLFKGKTVAVVGGGDSALEEALQLTKFAAKVYILHRRDAFRASKIMQDRVLSHEKIEVVWNSAVEEILGESLVSGIRLKDMKTGKEKTLAVEGMFIAIGHEPNTSLFSGKIELDKKGYAVLHPLMNNGIPVYTTMTSVPGVFAAGDVHDTLYRQAVTAAGFGCMAALDAEKWLEETYG